jgi:hypothetical protein
MASQPESLERVSVWAFSANGQGSEILRALGLFCKVEKG